MQTIRFVSVCSMITVTTFFTLSAASASSQHTPHGGHANHTDYAPIGVMGDHSHDKDGWMLSYHYSRMEMKGNRSGTRNVSTAQVLNDFMVAPLNMTMEMHMFGLMYGVNDRLTMMGMIPYVKKSMNHVNRAGVYFNTETEGLSDFKISGLYRLWDSSSDKGRGHKLLLNIGTSLPIGSIDEHGDTPAGANKKLPYPMQLGSGTFDPLLGLTYLSNSQDWSWGTQANTMQRFGKNSEGYRLGREYAVTAWVVRNVNKYASLSLRLDGKSWGDIHGRDIQLNPAMVSTARTDLRGGKRVDALIGLTLYQTEGVLAGHRLALEFGLPVYQHLDSSQLETDYRFTLGWQKVF